MNSRQRNLRVQLYLGILGIAVLALAGLGKDLCPVRAQSPAPVTRSAVTPSPTPNEALVSRLYATDQATVRSAIAELGRKGTPAAVTTLSEFVKNGQPDSITDYTLETLGHSDSVYANETLIAFTAHRRPSARLIAYQALARRRAPRASVLLSGALSDSDAAVRSAAAVALGSLGAREALPRLFLALDRGVPEAASTIGRLGDAESARAFTAYINRLPLVTLLAGYQLFLERKELAEKEKLEIVTVLGDLAVPEVKRFFQNFIKDGRAQGLPALKKAIEKAISRIKTDVKAPLPQPAPMGKGGQGALQ